MQIDSLILMIDFEMEHLEKLVNEIDRPLPHICGLLHHMDYLKSVILGTYLKTSNPHILKYVIKMDELISKISAHHKHASNM